MTWQVANEPETATTAANAEAQEEAQVLQNNEAKSLRQTLKTKFKTLFKRQ